MSSAFHQQLVELDGISASRLTDVDALSALVVAAAGAIGISADTPPQVRRGHQGVAVGLLCREGHIVLHTMPEAGICLVDIVGRIEVPVTKGVEVIARRLGGQRRTRAGP